MVKGVEELSSELHREPVVELESLESGEIEPVESGARNLSGLATESCGAVQRYAVRCRSRNWSKGSGDSAQLAGLTECCRVSVR